MNVSAWTWVHGNADKRLRPLRRVRKEIFFSFVIHCDSFAFWGIVVKNKKKILECEDAW